jgi:hypothetical protein
MDRDRRGRRRSPEQDRGLRPLHPLLPPAWMSRALRVAMSSDDWARFDALVNEASYRTPTQARAAGEVIAGLINESPRAVAGPPNWMDWERQKTLRLLRSTN